MVSGITIRADLPRKSFIEITVPAPPTPASVLTAASFIVISVEAGEMPSSVFTSERPMVPVGVAI
jgi:hypothetical protein